MTVVDISDNMHRTIIRKQSELFEVEGKKRTLAEIVEKALSKGLDLIDVRKD